MKNVPVTKTAGQSLKMKFVSMGVCVLVMLTMLGINPAFATALLVDRGLPTINLNNAAGASRSNVAWTFTNPNWGVGDDFIVDGNGTFKVDTLRTWVIGDYANTSFTLWGGDLASPLSTKSTSGTLQQVTYANGDSYQGSGGGFINIFELEFTNLNWLVNGGDLYNFGVTGKDSSGNYQQISTHASNAALGGSPAAGADGILLEFNADGPTTAYPNNFYWWASNYGPEWPTYNSWDKVSDLNVQIEGTPVPEPGTFMLFGLGLASLGALVRRRNKR